MRPLFYRKLEGMMTVSNRTRTAEHIAIKSVALPSEHGGWGFLLEPLVLGLLVAGSWRGLVFALAMVCAFLVHQPLKITLKDRLKGRRPPRTILAERFLMGYAAGAGIFGAIVWLATPDKSFILPLLGALPLLLIQVYYDAKNRSRAWLPELCGAVALASSAVSIGILGGWAMSNALWLWVMLIGRNIPSILYVRARLKAEHGNLFSAYPSHLSHAVTVIVATVFIAQRVIPATVFIAYGVLMARGVVGLSNYRKARQAKHIGMMEVGYGILTVIFIALGIEGNHF